MPNPNPHRRTTAPARADGRPPLPPGMSYRHNGSIHYRWTAGGRRHDAYGATPDECLAKRYTPKPEPAAVVIDERTTLAEYLRLWLAGLALRPNSVDTHRGNVDWYLIPTFGERMRLHPDELSREVVRLKLGELRLRQSRYRRPLAPRTVASAYATLRLALNTAVDDGRLKYNPAARINPHGTTGARARGAIVGLEHPIPTELELRRIRKAFAGDRLEPLMALTALTGLRQSEVLGLQWPDVGPKHITVSRGLRRTDRELDDPKSAGSFRHVPIGPVALELLERHRAAQALEALLAADGRGGYDNPGRLIFTKPTGAPLVGSTVSHRFADACQGIGLDYSFHDLRHFYASRLINAGVPIAVVSKLLGHADVSITSRTYHHLLKSDDTGTAAIAEGALG